MTNLTIQLKKMFLRLSLIALVLFSSCASRQDLVYFQDEPLNGEQINNMNTDLVYGADDILTIDVNSQEPLASQPFNLPAVSYSQSVSTLQGTLRMQTYLIDRKGTIEFPVLGTLKIGGLTRSEATAFLKEKLTEYIKDPIVNIRLTNFTITVLGEVNNPGTFSIQDERISLNEALGLAGDLTIYGKRDNVFLIREVDGEKRFAKLDLTSINIVNSTLYYMSQNDVLYVEPNKSRVRSSTYNPNTGLLISAVATLATITAILIR